MEKIPVSKFVTTEFKRNHVKLSIGPNTYMLVNATPHPINIFDAAGQKKIVLIPTHGSIRLTRKQNDDTNQQINVLVSDGEIPISFVQPFESMETTPKNLLAPCITAVIVSMPVADWMVKHKDAYGDLWIFIPDTGPSSVIRNEKGGIVGVRQLLCYNKGS